MEKEVYADFVDPTFTLLQDLARMVTEGKIEEAHVELLKAFNDPEVGNAVIMHFRVRLSKPAKRLICIVYFTSYPESFGVFISKKIPNRFDIG